MRFSASNKKRCITERLCWSSCFNYNHWIFNSPLFPAGTLRARATAEAATTTCSPPSCSPRPSWSTAPSPSTSSASSTCSMPSRSCATNTLSPRSMSSRRRWGIGDVNYPWQQKRLASSHARRKESNRLRKIKFACLGNMFSSLSNLYFLHKMVSAVSLLASSNSKRTIIWPGRKRNAHSSVLRFSI